jgi:hypothetical protein
MFPLPFHIYFEFAAFLTALLCWRYLDKRSIRWFVPFLLLIVVVELTGRYLKKELAMPNVWMYNITIPLEYLFLAFIFLRNFKSSSFRRLSAVFMVLFAAYTLIHILFIGGIHTFNSQVLTIGSFAMMLLSILCFYDLYLNTQTAPVWKLPIFWIAVGVLLFNAGEFAYLLFFDYLKDHGYEEASKIFYEINGKVIYLLYSSLIIAFLCSRVKTSKG